MLYIDFRSFLIYYIDWYVVRFFIVLIPIKGAIIYFRGHMNTLDFSGQFESMKQKVKSSVKKIFPIKGKTHTLRVDDIRLNDNLDITDYESQKKAKLGNRTWGVPVYADLSLVDNKTKKVVDTEKNIRLFLLPKYTTRASFIVKGNEYQFQNQLRLRPGIYTSLNKNMEPVTRVNTATGANFKLDIDKETGLIKVNLFGKRLRLYSILKGLGVSDSRMRTVWGDKVYNTNADIGAEKQKKEVSTVLQSFNIKPSLSPETNKELLNNYFNKSKLDGEVTKITLGKEYNNLNEDVLLEASKKLLGVTKGEKEPDDPNSLQFKSFHRAEDFITERIEKSKDKIASKLKRGLNNKTRISDIINIKDFNNVIESEYTSASHASVTDQYNPISMISEANRVTIMAEGGLTSTEKINEDARSLHPTYFGFLDPAQTPEGEKIGAINQLAVGATSKNGKLATKVYNLKKDKSEVLDAIEFYNEIVALPDQYEIKDGKFNWRGDKVQAIHKGDIKDYSVKKIKYLIPRSASLFSTSGNLIPFLQNNHGNRVMMASRQMEQALPLKNPEVPLVINPYGKSSSMYHALGKAFSVTSPVDGRVSRVTKKYITIKDTNGKSHKVNLYDDFPLNSGSFLDSRPTIKTGDDVKKGQLLADSNFTKGGILAQGVNLRTALIPYKGYNFEDGVVITESAAKRLTSEHMYTFETEVDPSTSLDITRFKRLYPTKYPNDIYNNYTSDGIIKKGITIKAGQPVMMVLKKDAVNEEDVILGKLRKTSVIPFKDRSIVWDKDVDGRVVEVVKGQRSIKVVIKTDEPASIGDKLTGRHGNKGIVTRIIPDIEAPQDKSGKPVEVLFNPHGIVSRMNVGQVYDGAVSKVGLKLGRPMNMPNFKPGVDYGEQIKELLKKSDVSETEELFDPTTGKSLGQIFVGYPHTFKLKQQSSKNLSARSRDKYDAMTLAPTKGGPTGGKALDLLTFYSMLAHGATENLMESATYKAEKNDEFWSALQNNAILPPPKPTFAYNKFINMLKASGVNVERNGTKLVLAPLTDKEILGLSNGEIDAPAKMYKSGKTLSEESGGLFDPAITGGSRGNRWAHIKLEEPLPNPVFEGAIKKLLDLTETKFTKILKGQLRVNEQGIISDEGDYTGGKAIQKLLSKIDVDKDLEKLEQDKKSAAKNQLDKINNKIRYLKALKKLNLKPEKAYVIHNVPVIPPMYRPIIASGSTLRHSPVNLLYRNLALNNQSLNDLKQWTIEKDGFEIPEEDKGETRHGLYKSTGALFGLVSPKQVGLYQKDVSGFIEDIAGRDKVKHGYFQSKLLSKRQDVVGRGTIIPDPNLSIDEIAIPKTMAWKIYNEFIIREYRKRGLKYDVARKEIDDQAPRAQSLLNAAMADRPLLLNRSPSLHKFSVMAFKPKLTTGNAIKIPPMVTGGFNADFDGDQMTVHIPISQKAVKEAEGMMPSKNLYNPGTGALMVVPSEAASLGIYRLSKTQNGRDVINKVIKRSIPEFREVRESLTKKKANELFNELGRKYPNLYSKVIDDLRELGDEYSYRSGVSISFKDVTPIKGERDKILSKAEQKADSVWKSKLSDEKKREKLESIYTEADKEIEAVLEEYFKVVDNTFNDMVTAGAKGKKTQVKQMLATPTLVKDYQDKLILKPIKNSLAEGLTVADFWNNQQGSRKTMIDKGLQVRQPGAFNKDIMSTTISTVITTKDCGTREGIFYPIDHKDNIGRYTAKPIRVSGRLIAPHNTVYTTGLLKKLSDLKVRDVELRSPLKCRAPKGVCSKCYGIGYEGKEYDRGDNVGAIAGQALTEPLTQMTLRSFHTGAVLGTGPVGYEKINTLLKMPQNIAGKAVLAKLSGKVTKIEKAPVGGMIVYVDDLAHYAPKDLIIKVKIGDKVKKGHPMTSGIIKPQELLELRGLDDTQKYLVDELDEAYSSQGVHINRKNFETVVRATTDTAEVISAGGHPSYVDGDVVPYSQINYYNKKGRLEKVSIGNALGHRLAKKVGKYKAGTRIDGDVLSYLKEGGDNQVEIIRDPITYKPSLVGMGSIPFKKKDWMTQMGYQRIKDAITRGASEAWESDIADPTAPIPGYVYGPLFGQGKLREL